MSKKEIVPKDSRYIPLTQQRYCCVPTSIQMIMLRHGIPLVPAELMAHYMEVVVPPDMRKLFWNVRSSAKRPPAGYGTQLGEDKAANEMFKKLGIPLEMKFTLIDNFSSADKLLEYLLRRTKANEDTIICYDYDTLFNTGRPNGHACVLDKVSKTKKEVRFIDPERNVPKWRTVKVNKLYKVMVKHGIENRAGCWELAKTKS